MTMKSRPKAATYYYGTAIMRSTVHLFVTNIVFSFAEAWALMVLLGMLAGYASVPGLAIGYWASYVVAFLWGVARGSTATVRSERW